MIIKNSIYIFFHFRIRHQYLISITVKLTEKSLFPSIIRYALIRTTTMFTV